MEVVEGQQLDVDVLRLGLGDSRYGEDQRGEREPEDARAGARTRGDQAVVLPLFEKRPGAVWRPAVAQPSAVGPA